MKVYGSTEPSEDNNDVARRPPSVYAERTTMDMGPWPWGTGYIGVRCTQEVGSSSTEPSNRGRDSNTSRRFPWRHRVAARGAAQVAAATSSRRREYVQSDRVRSHRPLLAMSGMPGCVEATDLHEPSPSYPSLPSLRAMEDKTMID